jgi:hypothetical protein
MTETASRNQRESYFGHFFFFALELVSDFVLRWWPSLIE